MMIHILRENGLEDDVDDSLLVKSAGEIDTEEEHTTWVEYRFPDSDVIVHRSVHVRKKRWPGELGALMASFQ